MTSPRLPLAVAVAIGVFRWLTRLMPRSYRARHREEAVALMAQLTAEGYTRAGTLGALGVAARAIGDFIVRLPSEHLVRLRQVEPGETRPLGRRISATIDGFVRDAKYGIRSLVRRPLSTFTAASTLAVGIGLNAAVFSVVDWVLLRPLPYAAPHELVRVFSAGARPATGPGDLTFSEYERFSTARAFQGTAAFSTATRIVAASGVDPVHVVVARVAGDLFGTLGVRPELGRLIDPRETADGSPVAVISARLWRRTFSADPSIAGRTIAIDGVRHSVVGVLPTPLSYPADADLWRPLTAGEREDDDRENVMIGRLRPDAGTQSASLELATLARGASKSTRTAWAEDVHHSEVRDVRTTLTALLASAALVLIMACANVAALVAARSGDRTREMAVRGALGAGRLRLFRQLLTENVILAAIGGSAGLLAGRWALDGLIVLAPGALPRLSEIALDARVVVAGMVGSLCAGVLVGLVPSIRASRRDVVAGLHAAESARVSRRTRTGRLMVLVQTGLAVVLTISAGLLGRTLQRLVNTDHGFAADQLIGVDLYLRGTASENAGQLFQRLVERAETVPGVRSAAVGMQLPSQVAGLRVLVRVAGSAGPRPATLRPVSTKYFETAAIPLVAGRQFSAADLPTAPRVALVNAAFVRDVLEGADARGLRLTPTLVDAPLTVVGVVGDVTPAGTADRPALYVPIDQFAIGGGNLLVRTDRDPAAIVPELTARLRTAAPALALDRVRPVADSLEAGRAVTRFNTQIAAAFSALALLLAAIGVYGLTAGEVTARWRELAVRLALGATPREALWSVMRPSAALLIAGLSLGVVASLAVGPWLASRVQGIQTTDVPAYLVAPALLGAIGLAAAALAAQRVLGADPAATLRQE